MRYKCDEANCFKNAKHSVHFKKADTLFLCSKHIKKYYVKSVDYIGELKEIKL